MKREWGQGEWWGENDTEIGGKRLRLGPESFPFTGSLGQEVADLPSSKTGLCQWSMLCVLNNLPTLLIFDLLPVIHRIWTINTKVKSKCSILEKNIINSLLINHNIHLTFRKRITTRGHLKKTFKYYVLR